MNSKERHEARYQRRKLKRKPYIQPTYEEVFSYDHLYEAYRKCIKNVKWKSTVQKFMMNATVELHKLHKELMERNVKTGRFYHFDIFERGKHRHIQSVGIKERIVQRCNCDYFLVPLLSRKLIHDNFACQKGKGYHYAMKRVKQHMITHYHKYGKRGYVLQFDFSKYFDTIDHSKLIAMFEEIIEDEDLLNLQKQLILDFDGDKGLGLGSQISQIAALFYPRMLDSAIKHYCNISGYGRYMDDGILIYQNKEQLNIALKEILRITKELEVNMNSKKTVFSKFGNSIVFLKAKYNVTNTGKVIIRPVRKGVHKNRRKLKKLKKLVDDGHLPFQVALNFYKSIIGRLRWFSAHNTALSFKQLFYKFFKEDILEYDLQRIPL